MKLYVECLTVCGDGALTELAEPTTTRVTNGVVCAPELSVRLASLRPPGLVLKVRSTVRGSSRTLVVAVRPPPSVAVSLSSIQHGYAWSGAENVPPVTPLTVWITWVWQSFGVEQWCMIMSQLSAEAGSVPCCGSVAWPEKLTELPTCHVTVELGASMTAVGAVLPTVTVANAVPVAP